MVLVMPSSYPVEGKNNLRHKSSKSDYFRLNLTFFAKSLDIWPFICVQDGYTYPMYTQKYEYKSVYLSTRKTNDSYSIDILFI